MFGKKTKHQGLYGTCKGRQTPLTIKRIWRLIVLLQGGGDIVGRLSMNIDKINHVIIGIVMVGRITSQQGEHMERRQQQSYQEAAAKADLFGKRMHQSS